MARKDQQPVPFGLYPPKSIFVGKGDRGTKCRLVGIAIATKDALYTGINSRGETIHAIVTNRFAHECQAAQRARGG